MAGTGVEPAPQHVRRGATLDPTGVRTGWLLCLPLVAGVLFLLAPIAVLAARAVSERGVLAFYDVVRNDVFLDASARTFVLSLVVTLTCALIGTVYAIPLVAAPPLLGRFLLLVLLGTFWISLLVRTFGWVILFQPNGALDQLLRDLGLTNQSLDLLQTTPAMYPAMVHVLLPFFVLPVYAACRRLDPDLLRAGQSLGARPLSVLWHVVLPQLRQPIVAAASLVFMLALAFYVTPLLIGGPSELTVATLINREFSERFDLAGAAAMALILMVCILAIYVVVDRFVGLVSSEEDGG